MTTIDPTDWTPQVRFPEGTPEYEAYRAELTVELDKFARSEPPYDRMARELAPSDDDATTSETRTTVLDPSSTDVDHVTARVLNAAMDWENTLQRHNIGAHKAHVHSDLLIAAHNLRAAIRSYMPLVTT